MPGRKWVHNGPDELTYTIVKNGEGVTHVDIYPTTKNTHQDKEHPGHYSEARSKVHDHIIKHALKGGRPSDKPFAIIIAGGPTAGKSTLIRALRKTGVIPDKGVVTINKRPFAELPEYSNLAHARHPEKTVSIMNEYFDLLHYIVEEAAKKKYPLVIEEHCDYLHVTKKLADLLKAHGYETAIVGMTTTPEAYFTHENRRCEAKHKNADHPWALSCHRQLAKHWEKYTKLFDFSILVKRNSKEQPLTVIAKAVGSPEKETAQQTILDERLYYETFKRWQDINKKTTKPEGVFCQGPVRRYREDHTRNLERSRKGSLGRGRETSAQGLGERLSFVEKLQRFATEATNQTRKG